MHQKLHVPIDNSYRAKSQSVRTLIQWHKDNPKVSRLVLSGQVLFPLLATLVMTLFFIYVIELEPRNIGRKLNNQVNSSVDYISASGEAKILIILTVSILFNICTLITDACALKAYHNLPPEVKEYYYHSSFAFRCFYAIPYLMLIFDTLSPLLFIVFPGGVVVVSYCWRNCSCRCKCAVATPQDDSLMEEENGGNEEQQLEGEVQVQVVPTCTATVKINWSILLYTLLSPLSCIATHAYHIIIAFIDNAYHASSVLLLFIIVLFIHVVVFQKIYYYVCKWRNSKKHSDCCKNFCWTILMMFCFLVGVLTLAAIIGLSVSILILIPIDNAIDNAPTNIYVIYQGSVAVIAALVTFQVFFRETNSVAEVFIKARDKMIQGRTDTKIQEENKQGTQPDSRDDKRWEKMSEKEKELHLATALLEYVFRKTKRCDNQTSASQTDPLAADSASPIPPTNGSPTLSSASPAQPTSGTSVPPPAAPEGVHAASPTPPVQVQSQESNGQEESSESMSPKNESHQEVTRAEIHAHASQ